MNRQPQSPEIIQSYKKSDLKRAIKFARSYSKTFKNTRVILENYEDAEGLSVWKNSNRSHDNNAVLLFLNGKRKRAIA